MTTVTIQTQTHISDAPKKICISGGAGFIGSHLARHLKSQGHYISIIDWQLPQYFPQIELCDEFHHSDCRSLEKCTAATLGADWVFHLACDMGGMGFIHDSSATCLFNNLMSSLSMIEASRINKVERFFYSSSACVYPQELQTNSTETISLKESTAWPADPQDGYGLEKLVSERVAEYYAEDFSMQVRIGRFHNIYGPHGTFKGGREKAPAAFIRKAICCNESTGMEIWGTPEKTVSRSFCYIDDAIEGILRIMKSDFSSPLNLGSDEVITMEEMANLALKIANKKKISLNYVPGPQGVQGRNSDNSLIKKVLNWSPSIRLEDGLNHLYNWMKPILEEEAKSGVNIAKYATSRIINTVKPPPIGKVFKSIEGNEEEVDQSK